jgi:hypothetical protein
MNRGNSGLLAVRGRVLFYSASRSALGPTQPPIQWMTEVIRRSVKLTTPSLVQWLRMCGVVPPLPHTCSNRDAQVSTKTVLPYCRVRAGKMESRVRTRSASQGSNRPRGRGACDWLGGSVTSYRQRLTEHRISFGRAVPA